MRVLLKEKAPKQKVERQISHINEVVTNSAMRLDQVFAGLEMSIAKNSANKAEMKDLEGLDKAKAGLEEV